jgi:hypothetical protein
VEGVPTFRTTPAGVTASELAWPSRLAEAGLQRALIVSGQAGSADKHAAMVHALKPTRVQAQHLALAFGHVPDEAAIDAIEQAALPLRNSFDRASP